MLKQRQNSYFLDFGLALILLVVLALPIRLVSGDPQPRPSVLGVVDYGIAPQAPASFAYPEHGSNPEVLASSFLVWDSETGQTLLSKNENQPLGIASLTKLITTLLTVKYLNSSDFITIKKADEFDVSPVLHLRAGDEVKVLDLVNAMLVGSANDAALALSHELEAKSNKNFALLASGLGSELGLSGSNFSNPLGFDSTKNYSTAGDLSLIVNAVDKTGLLAQTNDVTSYSFKSKAGKNFVVKATNKLLLKDKDIHAVKTGYTNEALGSMIVYWFQENRKIFSIVLHSPQREADTEKISKFVRASFKLNN